MCGITGIFGARYSQSELQELTRSLNLAPPDCSCNESTGKWAAWLRSRPAPGLKVAGYWNFIGNSVWTFGAGPSKSARGSDMTSDVLNRRCS